MLVTPVLLASCKDGANGKDGADGKDGAMWYRGTANIDTVTDGKAGDFYIDTDDYKLYQKDADGSWALIMDNFGKQGDKGETGDMGEPGDTGDTGEPGNPGETGESGLTPYIGYDGYWWTGTERCDYKAIDVMSMTTVETTVGLIGNEYFDSYAIDMGKSKIAIMSNYFPTIKKTVYSGMAISTLEVFAETAGTLTVSTAKTASIADRTVGSSITLNKIVKLTLKVGFNTLDLDGYVVPEGETLVLGETGDTAKLTAYKGVGQSDKQGLFTVLSETGLYKQTNGLNDKLVINVERYAGTVEAIPGLQELIDTPVETTGGSIWKGVSSGPFANINMGAYRGKTVEKIDIRAFNHTATDKNNLYITVMVVKASDATLVSTHKFYANAADISDTELSGKTLNKMLTLTCSHKVTVAEDEVLVFGQSSDTLHYSYRTDLNETPITGGYMNVSVNSKFGSKTTHGFLAANVYVKDTRTVDHFINKLQEEEYMKIAELYLKSELTGKKVSVVGDSISTYLGVSNNGNANSTIASNKVYFGEGKDPNHNNSLVNNIKLDDTWWMQTISNNGMTLNVNNSYSGSWVTDTRPAAAGCADRAINLHTDSGEKPDIIAVYIGINDLGSGSRPCNKYFEDDFFARVEGGTYTKPYTSGGYTIPTYFDEGYALMISKMKKAYPDADIFCFTLPECRNGKSELLARYNNAIKNIAEHYGLSVVDLHETEFSTNYTANTLDGLHPNIHGMDIITREFTKALIKKYLPSL